MDFLDPDKWRRHNRTLMLGYALVGTAIAMTALVLLYQSFGYGIDDDGEVIQNGLVFTGSTPDGADVIIDNKDTGFDTDKRLILGAGKYNLTVQRTGYDRWSRSIDVVGGSVNRLDYSFLFPTNLDTRTLKKYDASPVLATQSPDRRWVIMQTTDSLRNFDVFDLRSPNDPPVRITIPESIITDSENQSYELVEWSNDNSHMLVKHFLGSTFEYILINRESPEDSVNLSGLMKQTPTELSLVDKKYDQYYLYDEAAKTLKRATLNEPAPVDYLKNVLEYKSYGDDTVLYVTDDVKNRIGEPEQVAVKLAAGDQTYTLRRLAPSATYLLEMAEFDGDTYIVAGSIADGKTFIYRNPVTQIKDTEIGRAMPFRLLKLDGGIFVSFSQNTRFIMVQNGTKFAVYDIELDQIHAYDKGVPMDAGQEHATWMDGHRLQYVSNGQLIVFDYDNANSKTLLSASSVYRPFYTPNFRQVLTLSPQVDDSMRLRLAATWLTIQADR